MNDTELRDLRTKRQDELDRGEAILAAAEREARGVSEDEQKQLDGHIAEAKRIEGVLADHDRLTTSRAALQEARNGYTVPDVARPTGEAREQARDIEVRENPYTAYQKGDAFGAIVAARLKFGPWEHQRAINWAREMFGGESRPEVRALQQTSFSAGGALIPENFVGSEFIELLRAQSALRRAGARQVTLVNGTFTAPKLTAGVTGGWIGAEGDNITTTEPTFGQLVLAEKKYAAIVPFSNDLRRNASLDAIRVVRDDLVTEAANREDVAFLKGDGLSGQPKGIYYWVGDAGRTDTAGTALANVRQDIRVAKNFLDSNNAPNSRRAWFMHSKSMNYMGWDLVDGNSNFAFPSLQNSGGASLGGDPVFKDNNISITLGSGDKSEIYYVELSECFIGDAMGMEIEVFDNAAYSQSSTIRSGISRDESVLRLIRKVDFGMRHIVSAHVTEAVSYGN